MHFLGKYTCVSPWKIKYIVVDVERVFGFDCWALVPASRSPQILSHQRGRTFDFPVFFFFGSPTEALMSFLIRLWL